MACLNRVQPGDDAIYCSDSCLARAPVCDTTSFDLLDTRPSSKDQDSQSYQVDSRPLLVAPNAQHGLMSTLLLAQSRDLHMGLATKTVSDKIVPKTPCCIYISAGDHANPIPGWGVGTECI